MKKVLVGIIVTGMFAFSALAVTSCVEVVDSGEKEQVTVSFVQEGQETIEKTIDKGGSISLKDIPVPVNNAKYGYEIKWDRTNFKNLTEDTVVNAVEVAKKFVLMFESNGGEAIDAITYTYDAPYELPVPVRAGYEFKCWYLGSDKLEQSGVWSLTANVSVKAEWEEIS